jgi:membrane fusion protein, multidrug efflux system
MRGLPPPILPWRPWRKLVAMVGAVVVAGLIAAFTGWHGSGAAAKSEVGQTHQGQQGPVPVLAAKAKAEDVPIILRGIGSVQAYNTVSVKSRVDGNITQIAYKEGQDVKAGDLLIQLDSRPYQAALDQSIATLEKDQANLSNARLKMARDAIVNANLAVSRQQYDNDKAAVGSA